MAQCDIITPLLGTFEDGELPPHEMQQVARHLASCTNCERTLAGYSSVGRLLRDSAPAPALDGFATGVQRRIAQLRPPLRARVGRWFDSQRERFGGGLVMAFAMAAAAVLTVVVTTPLARNMIGAGNHVTQVAMSEAQALKRGAQGSLGKTFGALASVAGREPSTIISKLDTSNPDVAVWSEPTQGTTVIWLPEQQP